MSLEIADRVKETSTTTGTGTLDLDGAVSKFQGFVAAVGDANTCYYAIVNHRQDEWEVGLGTVTDGTPDTLSRDVVTASSNSGSAVDFSAGTKDIFLTLPAVAIPNHEISVENCGAVGDGTTDDSTAIQAAIDLMEANGGGTVRFIPGKTYALGAGLMIDSDNITLDGPGANLIQKANIEAGVVLAVAGSDGSEISKLRIRGLEIDANYGNQVGGNTPRGLQVKFAYDVVIEQVTVRNAWVCCEFADGATYGAANDCVCVNYYNDGFEVTGTSASEANKPQHITLRNPCTYSADAGADNSIEIEDGAKDVSVIGGTTDKRLEIRNHDLDNMGTTENIYVIGHTSPSIRVVGRVGKEDNTVQNIFIMPVESDGGVSVTNADNVTVLSEVEFSLFGGSFVVATTGDTTIDGHLQLADDKQLQLGDAQDYTIQWNGSDAVHTITTGDFQFTGGGIILDDTIDSNVGVIFKGATAFIHNFHHPTGGGAVPVGRNIFVGENSGNFTMGSTATLDYHSSSNLGFGVNTLTSLTTGHSNVAIGYQSLCYATTGSSNVAAGKESLKNHVTGIGNVAIGAQSGKGTTDASNVSGNTFIGHQTGLSILTGGDNNVFIGYQTGRGVTTGSGNILIGYDLEPPAVDTDNYLNIGGIITGDLSTGGVTARIVPRVTSEASSATPTPNADTTYQYNLTALAEAAAFAVPSGTPTDGQELKIRIKDNGTTRALTWNAIYRVVGQTLPTDTTAGKLIYIGLIYNTADTKWDVVAKTEETQG